MHTFPPRYSCKLKFLHVTLKNYKFKTLRDKEKPKIEEMINYKELDETVSFCNMVIWSIFVLAK